ncbi:Pseudouridine synthase I TruA [Gracilaria domingensis]|nr:Pseudouridine synthase I TruA [Gracilaria domingensis]
MPPHHNLTEKQLRAMSRDELLSLALTRVLPQVSSASQENIEIPKTHRRASNGEPPRKKPRQFDMNRYGQRHIALRIMYTGWRFHGFAAQIDSENTVEAHVFSSLLKTRLISSRADCDYSRAGRTDVGVSAACQVIGLRVRSNVKPPSTGQRELDYVKIVNGTLPQGVRCTGWTPVSDGTSPFPTVYEGDPLPVREYWTAVSKGQIKEVVPVRRPGQQFSARFDAVHRSYKYFFPRGDLDINAMRHGASFFKGKHDFRNFCRIDENVTNFERHMFAVEIRRMCDDSTLEDYNDDEYTIYYIFVKGQAFLWHQVRCMAAVLFDIGMRNENPNVIKRLLDDARTNDGSFSNGRPQYRMASPTPLLLYECIYPRTVLHFPQTFERDFDPSLTSTGDPRRTSFERANLAIAKDFAGEAAKMSILQTVLKDQDGIISYPSQNETQVPSKPFKELRGPRDFVIDKTQGRHIPYDKRLTDDSLELKQKKAALKLVSIGESKSSLL